jgi:membrane protein
MGWWRRIPTVYEQIMGFTARAAGIVRAALDGFQRARASEAAASLAYYALFSLFPLLLALTSAGGYFLKSQQAYDRTMALVGEALPGAQALIERNIQQILDLRGTVGVVGVVGLLWSALGVFSILARNVSRAYPQAEPRGFLRSRLVGLAMVGMLASLLALSIVATALGRLLPGLGSPVLDGLSLLGSRLWRMLANLASASSIFLMFLALYRWAPNTEKALCRGAVWGALVAALAWEGAAILFAWFLSSGLVQYQLIYGSLGTVVSLMLWIYISSLITLFGAHLSAVISTGPYDEAE